jgi:hypothetical protein
VSPRRCRFCHIRRSCIWLRSRRRLQLQWRPQRATPAGRRRTPHHTRCRSSPSPRAPRSSCSRTALPHTPGKALRVRRAVAVRVQCPARSTPLESPRASASAAVGAPAADGAPSAALPVSAMVVSLRRRRRIRPSLPRDVGVPSPRRLLRPSLQLLMVVTQWHGMPVRSPCPLFQLPLPRWMPVRRLALQPRPHLRCYRCCGTMTTYLSAGRTRRRDGGAIFLLRLLH